MSDKSQQNNLNNLKALFTNGKTAQQSDFSSLIDYLGSTTVTDNSDGTVSINGIKRSVYGMLNNGTDLFTINTAGVWTYDSSVTNGIVNYPSTAGKAVIVATGSNVLNDGMQLNVFDSAGNTYVTTFNGSGYNAWQQPATKADIQTALGALNTIDPAYTSGSTTVTDFHTLTTPGTYTTGFGNVLNCPPELNGTYVRFRVVVAKALNGAGLTQTAYTLDGDANLTTDEIWYETYHDNKWSNWQKFISDSTAASYASSAASSAVYAANSSATSYTSSTATSIANSLVSSVNSYNSSEANHISAITVEDNNDGTVTFNTDNKYAMLQNITVATDYNNITTSGWYSISVSVNSNCAHNPLINTGINATTMLQVVNDNSGDIYQTVYVPNKTFPFIRQYSFGAWTNWQSTSNSSTLLPVYEANGQWVGGLTCVLADFDLKNNVINLAGNYQKASGDNANDLAINADMVNAYYQTKSLSFGFTGWIGVQNASIRTMYLNNHTWIVISDGNVSTTFQGGINISAS